MNIESRKWTLLLTGEHYGLVGQNGKDWSAHPGYEIVNVCEIGAQPASDEVRNQVLEEAASECERMMMFEGARQESYAHDTVWKAAQAIRALKKNTTKGE